MIYAPYPEGEDLFVHLHVEPTPPVRYRHLKRGTTYLVVSDGEHFLNEISYEGSTHDLTALGLSAKATFQFSGGVADESGRQARYGGPIVIYVAESDGKVWIRPHFEFHDGRFEKVI